MTLDPLLLYQVEYFRSTEAIGIVFIDIKHIFVDTRTTESEKSVLAAGDANLVLSVQANEGLHGKQNARVLLCRMRASEIQACKNHSSNEKDES